MPEDETQQALSERTFGNEDALPRVPLPTLAESGQRLLQWCAPLISPDELAETEAAVAALLDPAGSGPRLQATLEAYDADPAVHSWLDTFWQFRYLGRRDRIAGNANFFFLFNDDPSLADDEPQLRRAAGLVIAAVNHKLALDAETVPPGTLRGEALTMQQHKYLFATTRIPGFAEDTVHSAYSAAAPGPAPERYIAVLFRGHIFCLDVIGEDGVAHSIGDLLAGLREIRERGAQSANPETAVGQLTSRARSQWAATRQGMLGHHPHNKEALETVERALLCLCLDEFASSDVEAVCEQLLQGDAANRWFDKSVSLIVFADGRAGINVEHCGLDGTTVIRFVEALLSAPAADQARQAGAGSQGTPVVAPVEFELDDALRANVRLAGEEFAEHKAGIATCTRTFDDFGADTVKALGVSPDAFVQLAYQLAHQRTKGFVGATYESIATLRFHHGRTEAMRVVTPESSRFVTTMDDPDADSAARETAFRAAADAHVRRQQDCQGGRAPEQHLWELQRIAQRRGRELGLTMPEVFSSPGWQRMRDDYLSTSSAPSGHIQYFGFSSTSEHCIGVAYVLLPQRFSIHLSTPVAVAGQMYTFRDELATAIAELRDLLTAED